MPTLDTLLNTLSAIIVIIGALWAYFRFFREGQHKPRIEFDIEAEFHGPQEGSYIGAFQLKASNKGHIEHTFESIRLRIKGVSKETGLSYFKKSEPRLEFPLTMDVPEPHGCDTHRGIKECPEGSGCPEQKKKGFQVIPDRMEYYFVRPGVTQRFSYVTKIPASWSVVLCKATFRYRNSEDTHTAERVFRLERA